MFDHVKQRWQRWREWRRIKRNARRILRAQRVVVDRTLRDVQQLLREGRL